MGSKIADIEGSIFEVLKYLLASQLCGLHLTQVKGSAFLSISSHTSRNIPSDIADEWEMRFCGDPQSGLRH